MHEEIKRTVEDFNKVKSEISELETRRQPKGSGVRGFLRNMALNKQIADKRNILRTKDRISAVKQQTELGTALVAREKVKTELSTLKKKNMVNFDDLYKAR